MLNAVRHHRQHHAAFDDALALLGTDGRAMRQTAEKIQIVITQMQPLGAVVNAVAVRVCGVNHLNAQGLAQQFNPCNRRAHFVFLEAFVRQTSRERRRVGALRNACVVFE